jgi:hypothetical protein
MEMAQDEYAGIASVQTAERSDEPVGRGRGQHRTGVQGQLVMCRVDELHPHPSCVRHHLAVPVSQLSTLAEIDDLAFLDPLVITRGRIIIDGYARWKLALLRERLTLPCIEYELDEAEALHWLLQKHRRSKGLNDFSRIRLALELEPHFRGTRRKTRNHSAPLPGNECIASDITAEDSAVAAMFAIEPGRRNLDHPNRFNKLPKGQSHLTSG